MVRPGYATEKMLRRFEMEAEVLGRLLHPGIAQIYEAGVWTSPEREREGLPPTPFFAMELVRGVPLTKYAEGKTLSTRERLELVAKVCDAVQHAHQKGVIHRDLKPSNILVTELDAPSDRSTQHPARSTLGQPKILDFGVARATDSDIQQTTMETDVGAIIGTIPYMSPEQVGGDPAELDTRSDVYALGVIAYELLVGRLPYSLERKMIHEAARIIREEEPTRLSSIDRTLRGDIETIVAHALEKDKARRYGAASALAADIRRYLSDEPIAARRASTWYQFSKFSRRNKGLVAGVGLAFAFLSVGLTFALVSRSQAVAASMAEKERADQLTQVSAFQSDMLSRVDPTTAGVRLKEDLKRRFAESLAKATWLNDEERATERESFDRQLTRINGTDAATAFIETTILRPGTSAVRETFKDQPILGAALLATLAHEYCARGLHDSAYPLQKEALDTRRHFLGDAHPDTLISFAAMGKLLAQQGMLDEAEQYCHQALVQLRRVLGEEHLATITVTTTLGSILRLQGKLTEAEQYYRSSLNICRRVLGEDDPLTLDCVSNLGNLLIDRADFAQSESYLREVLERRRRVLGEEHPSTLLSINILGTLLHEQGKLIEAEAFKYEAVQKRRRVLGEEHPDTLTSINNMGSLLKDQGKLAEAEPYCREALEKRRRVLGDEHPETLTSINNMGALLQERGMYAEAQPYQHEALEKRRRVLGEDHRETIQSASNMGILLQLQGKLNEAEPYIRESLEKRRMVLGEEHPETLASISKLVVLLRTRNNLAEAEPLAREVMAKRRRVLGDDHPDTLSSISDMGSLLLYQGKPLEAEPYCREALEKRRRLLSDGHPQTLVSLNNMGGVFQLQRRFAEAEPYCREALEHSRRVNGEPHPTTIMFTVNLGKVLRQQDKHQEAIELLGPVEDAARTVFTGTNVLHFASLLANLGRSRAALAFEPARFALAEVNMLEALTIYSSTRGKSDNDARGCLQALIDFYATWDKADPGKGYDAKAAEWKAKLDAIAPPAAGGETK